MKANLARVYPAWRTGIGRSCGYNRNEDASDYLSVEELVAEFVDIVSKNGSLVLNVGPRPGGTIPPEQTERLRAFGRWLEACGEAYFESSPWTRAEGATAEGSPVRFTLGADGVLYAMVIGAIPDGVVSIGDLSGSPSHVRLLGFESPLSWSTEGDVLHIALPDDLPEQPAYAFAIRASTRASRDAAKDERCMRPWILNPSGRPSCWCSHEGAGAL